MRTTETISIGNAALTFETGELARQAHGAVVVRHLSSMLLATAVVGGDRDGRDGRDFLPLTVEYRERMSAGGRVPGGYLRREGRLGDHEILTSRLIDRILRPLFPKGFRREVQVLVTCFGADSASDLQSLAILAAAAALHVSSVPFAGPVAGIRISAHGDGSLRTLAKWKSRSRATMDWIIALDRRGLVMLEGGANEASPDAILAAMDEATAVLTPVLDLFDRLRAAAGRDKLPFAPPAVAGLDAIAEAVAREAGPALDAAWRIPEKVTRRQALDAALAPAWAAVAAREGLEDELLAAVSRRLIRSRTAAGARLGGRASDEVRPLSAQVAYLPAAHGSALFSRGDTQALVTATLGTADDAREYETALGKRGERFMLHYNFPPFSVGETRPQRGPGRREIGHGNLARRAILPVLPKRDALPWVIRVVSDVLESDGSSSMATVCGASLALFDAGVALAAPVAGIAMGLVHEGDEYTVLTDITGQEDALGDMDFKVAGTRAGVTALQLDNKLGAIPREVLADAFGQARRALDHVLDAMDAALPGPREKIADHAPQVAQLSIPKRTIGRLIGPGGRRIQELQTQTRTRIDVRDDGRVRVFAKNPRDLALGIERVRGETLVLEVGASYDAEVVSIKEYGAFVRIGTHEGLVHISELAPNRGDRVDRVEDVVRIGDAVRVRVQGTDDRGRLELSRRAALEPG